MATSSKAKIDSVRERQIKGLLRISSWFDRVRIRRGRKAGRRLRKINEGL